jgi:hypothetical protein
MPIRTLQLDPQVFGVPPMVLGVRAVACLQYDDGGAKDFARTPNRIESP